MIEGTFERNYDATNMASTQNDKPLPSSKWRTHFKHINYLGTKINCVVDAENKNDCADE
jgi:hypothetical protein